jgi:hypothetical protein
MQERYASAHEPPGTPSKLAFTAMLISCGSITFVDRWIRRAWRRQYTHGWHKLHCFRTDMDFKGEKGPDITVMARILIETVWFVTHPKSILCLWR